MPHVAPEPRFCVHEAAAGRARALAVEAEDAFEAALAFAAAWHEPGDEEHLLSLIVEDRRTGESCCLCVDLDAATARPCD